MYMMVGGGLLIGVETLNDAAKKVYGSGLLDVSKEVIQSIKLSFDFLKNEAAESCFLHCCLFPEDWDIPNEELMYMMFGGGLLIGVETLNDAQSRVDLLLDQLKARGLLLQGSSEGYVRMHDVVRDVAVWISQKDHVSYVRAGQSLAEWPRTIESEMQNYRWLSLMDNNIEDLPPDPMEYPKLETLILSDNEGLSNIPEIFFQHMGSLMVLDLSSIGMKSLPKSFSCLTNLRVLNLGKCYSLKDISHINGLKMLEILILDGAPVSIAPEGLGWAQNLRVINLGISVSFPPFLDNYFSKELPKFRRLERLFMNKFVGSFQELTSLRHLTHLFIYQVADMDDSSSHELVSPGSWPDRLLEFNICFLQNEPRYYWSLSNYRRVLQLMGTKPLAGWAKRLLAKTINLVLVEFQGTELISISSNIPSLAFSSLEHLRVVNWPNLTNLLGDELLLLHDQIPLNQLKQMTISNCPRLTNLTPSRLCQRSMQKLEELSIKDCPIMLELFPCDHKAHGMTELLLRLKSFTLQGLQRLQNVLQPFQCLPKLEGLTIRDCGMRYALSFETETVAMADPFPTLEVLDIKNCRGMREMISPHTSLQAPCFFQGLFSLKIGSCTRLTHLFSYKQAISMQHLSKLHIQNCAALKAVVISTEKKEEAY
ncbi:probable disease resistance protein At4g27220 [Dioscorea cayenensis subsp. rotundata]|uniref:Probable disease resistance protein At4g27220 n=1 Tax=Dioscorea cayennensis subsp. rotundata TaxID=55577 RepID=A0AB40AZ19_DIOCR|nr:probable disease resistance protein At4g27220 [Dioscorea cayenensis subsp. rotundata]